MKEEKTQIADGVASELNAELGFNLWKTANKTTPFTTFRQSNGQHSVVMQFKNEEDCFNFYKQLLLFFEEGAKKCLNQ